MKIAFVIAFASSALLAATSATNTFVGTLGQIPVKKASSPISPQFWYFSAENNTASPEFWYFSAENNTASPEFWYFSAENNTASPEFWYFSAENDTIKPEFWYFSVDNDTVRTQVPFVPAENVTPTKDVASTQTSAAIHFFSNENEKPSTTTTKFGVFATQDDYCLVGQNIDFNGADLASYQGGPETCCGKCKSNSACAGYTWTNYQGGTCWLKSSIASPKLSMGAKGCVVGDNSGPSTAQFSNCDMPGNDESHVQVAESKFSICELWCWASPGCAAVTWTNYEGGTCWFKRGVANCAAYPGAKTTVVFNEGRFGRR